LWVLWKLSKAQNQALLSTHKANHFLLPTLILRTLIDFWETCMHAAIRKVISQIICARNWFPDPGFESMELQPSLWVEKFGMFKTISIQKFPYPRGNIKFTQKIIIYISKTCWNFQKIFFQKEMNLWRKMSQHLLEY
jgi:hypothetical protein